MSITADKILGHVDRIAGNHKPITADIFLTNFCNNLCPYCTYRRWELDAGAKSMTFEEFVSYAKVLRSMGVEGMILTGGGEPTLCYDFMRITQWLENENIHYGINTNFNKLLFFKPDYLKVSLDGWDEDSYKAARGVQQYHTVCNNIIQYADWKEVNSPTTSLGIQKVIADSRDIIPFYEGNKDLPVDYIVIRPLESTLGCYYREKDKAEDALRSIDIIKRLAEKDSRVVLNPKWYQVDVLNGGECTAHWAQIALNERGEVMYCCHKPYEVVGHILDKDILYKHSTVSTDMSLCDVPCRLTASNMILQRMSSIKEAAFI